MADAERIDALTDALLAYPPGSPGRSRASGALIAYLRDSGDLRNWVKNYWSSSWDAAHSADDYVSVETIALTAYLTDIEDLPAQGRPGILYSVATKAVAKLVDTNADTGFTEVSSVRTRARLFLAAEARARAEGEENPNPVALIDSFNSTLTPSQIKDGQRLRREELSLYRAGGTIITGTFDGYDYAGENEYERRDQHQEAADTLELMIDRIVNRIMRDNAKDSGLIWFSIVLSRYLAFGDDVDIAEVSAEAGFTTEVGGRYHAIIMSNPPLRELVEAGAPPAALVQPALDADPSGGGVISYARALLGVVSRIAPNEMELVTYTNAWLRVTEHLGRRPRLTEVVEDVDERYGAATLDPAKTKGYQRTFATILREIVAETSPALE